MPSTTRSKRRKTPSTVGLKGAPEGEGGTAKPSTTITAEEKEMEEKFEGGRKELNKKSEDVKRRIEEAKAMLTESHEVEVQVHFAFRRQYAATGIRQRGMSVRTTAQRTNQTTLRPNDQEAFEMQKLTNSTLTAEDIANAEYKRHVEPSTSDGLFAGWKKTDETTVNSKGKTVLKNHSIVNKEVYKYLEENNMGAAKWNKEHSHGLKTEIPRRANQLPHFISIGDEGEHFTFAEVPSTWDKPVSFHDALSHLFGYSDINVFCNSISCKASELGGMRVQRFSGDQIVVRKGTPQKVYKKAGYRLIFQDGNNTRFDVLQDNNSSISDDAEGDSKPSAK